MKKIFFQGFVLSALLCAPSVSLAATLYSQSVTLSSGWNVVSTPRVLDSHSFSATENSANFDIYVLDASQTSGWATMSALGQTEFMPLYGYFINNKTGSNQTLTFNYLASTTPNQRLFNRTFSQTGWYSVGVANPTYAKAQGAASSTDSNNPNDILYSLRNFYSHIVDFTVSAFSTNSDSAAVGTSWSAYTYSDGNLTNDFRETKGYALYINVANGLYSGFQNDNTPACSDGVDNDSDGLTDYGSDPGCSDANDTDESNIIGTLSISASSSPSSQNVSAGASAFTFANIQLDASSSGENVRTSSLKLRFTFGSGAQTSDLSTCQLFNGSTALNTGANVPSSLSSGGATTFTLDNVFIISSGTVTSLSLKCNISSGASAGATYAVGVNSSDSFSATGVTSGASITPTVTTGTSGTMTVASATLAVSVDSSSPSYSLVAAGTTGQTLGVLKFRASNEAITLNKIGLTLTNSGNSKSTGNGGSTNNGVADIVQVYVYDGATLVGTATFTGSNTSATSTLSSSVTLPKDTDKTLTIKADLAQIGSGETGGIGDLIAVDPSSAEGSGQSSGITVKSGATAGVAGIRLFNSYPTLALDSLPSTGIADGRLMRFKITANSAGSVGVSHFEFKVSTTSGVTVTNVQLFGYTDSAYSSAISDQGTSGQVGGNVTSVVSGTAFAIEPTSSAIQIPAGTTRYFELRASIAGVDTGDSVVTTLLGDSAHPTNLVSGHNMLTSAAATSTNEGNFNFVWSGNSTTTSAYSDIDWSNGYGVSGLPSSGLIQTRSN